MYSAGRSYTYMSGLFFTTVILTSVLSFALSKERLIAAGSSQFGHFLTGGMDDGTLQSMPYQPSLHCTIHVERNSRLVECLTNFKFSIQLSSSFPSHDYYKVAAYICAAIIPWE